MIPSVISVLPSTGATPPITSIPGPNPGASGSADASAPLLQSTLEPVHNVVGFVFKIADTQTGRIIVALPFAPDPDAPAPDGGPASAHVDVKI